MSAECYPFKTLGAEYGENVHSDAMSRGHEFNCTRLLLEQKQEKVGAALFISSTVILAHLECVNSPKDKSLFSKANLDIMAATKRTCSYYYFRFLSAETTRIGTLSAYLSAQTTRIGTL